nr:EOG090X0B12 [Sida crystallina]
MEPELNAEETEKLVQFQELSGIDDLQTCRRILQQHFWNVESAIHDHLNDHSGPRPDSPRVPTLEPLHQRRNGQANGAVAREGQVSRPRPSPPTGFFHRIASFVFHPFPFAIGSFSYFLFNTPTKGVNDPTWDVTSFIQEYDRVYGPQHPVFYTGNYSQVLNEAKKELKFLLVYLHCRDHQDTDSFCRGTLADPSVISYVDQTCLMWACSVNTLEGYRVSQSLRENSYPFVAVIVQREFRMTVVGRIEGAVGPSEFLQRVQAIVADNEAFLVVARADREERSFNQALRQEQDEAYLESLRADREKEERKRLERQQLEEQEQQKLREVQAEMKLRDELVRRKADAILLVPEEPPAEESGCCRILVRLPCGHKLERRFSRSRHSLKVTYSVISHNSSPNPFIISINMNKMYKVIPSPDLKYGGLRNGTSLHIHLPDELFDTIRVCRVLS